MWKYKRFIHEHKGAGYSIEESMKVREKLVKWLNKNKVTNFKVLESTGGGSDQYRQRWSIGIVYSIN